MTVRLKKDPGIGAGSEAIRAGKSRSTGRPYNRIGDTAEAAAKCRISGSTVCAVSLPGEYV